MGGTHIITDNSGNIVKTKDFFPFGAERINTGSSTEDNSFTGYEHDESTGLDYAEARYYNSEVGRFISQDPALFDERLLKSLSNPQRLNSYTYSGNNPINYVDRSGEFWWKEFYTDWDGYEGFSGVMMKMGEVLGGRSKALYEIQSNADTIKSASERAGVSQDLIKAIIYEEQSHQNPPFGGESIIENVAPWLVSGGIGIMQVSSGTSKLSNKSLLNPQVNINAGAKILGEISNRVDTIKQIGGGYNGGKNPNAKAQRYGERINGYVGSRTHVKLSGKLDRLASSLGKLVKKIKNYKKSK